MSSLQPGKSPVDSSAAVPRTRADGVWIASVLFALILLLLLIFIWQNTQRAEISFFGIHANPPVGVALLLAAVFGILLVAVPGTARIVQLRILARHRGQTVAAINATDAQPPVDAAPHVPQEAPPSVPAPVPPSAPPPVPPAQTSHVDAGRQDST
jgi:lipopolysaccharide assembly protein A